MDDRNGDTVTSAALQQEVRNFRQLAPSCRWDNVRPDREFAMLSVIRWAEDEMTRDGNGVGFMVWDRCLQSGRPNNGLKFQLQKVNFAL